MFDLVLILISSLFLTLSFEHPYLGFFSLIALLPFFFLIYKNRSLLKIFYSGWLIGFLFFLISWRWLLAIFPNNALGIKANFGGLILVFFIWFGVAILLGLSFGIFALMAKFLFQRPRLLIFSLPSAWILTEYLRAIIFSIVIYGKGGSLGPYWTLGSLGYALVDLPGFSLAPFIGLYGLSFLVAFFGAALFLFILKFRQEKCSSKKIILPAVYLILAILLIFTSSLFLNQKDPTAEPIRIMALANPERKIIYRNLLSDLLKQHFEQPDIFILPEDVQLFVINGDEEKKILRKIFPDQNKSGVVVTSALLSEEGKRFRKIFYVSNQGEILDIQIKKFLIPGEYLPVFWRPLFSLFISSEKIENFLKKMEVSKGKKEIKPFSFGQWKIGSLLCSANFSPLFYRNLVRGGANFLVLSASYSVFKKTHLLQSQLETLSRFQAAVNRRPFIQSVFGDGTLIIDQNGKIVARSSKDKAEILSAEIFPQKAMTLAARFGDYFLLIALIIIIVQYVIIFVRFK